MSTITAFELGSLIRKQSETRKTVDLALLQEYIVKAFNTMGKTQDNSMVDGLRYNLDCYNGYNTRAWMMFTTLPKSYEIVRTLQAIDDEKGTRHYWHMLERIEHGTERRRWYYGTSDKFTPTLSEKMRAQRIHDRYVKVLGL